MRLFSFGKHFCDLYIYISDSPQLVGKWTVNEIIYNNKALKRDWRRTKNLRTNLGQNADDVMLNPRSGVSVSTNWCMIVYLPHGSSNCKFWCIY